MWQVDYTFSGGLLTQAVFGRDTDHGGKIAASNQVLKDAIIDYVYDVNGNLTKDYNKDIGNATTVGIQYNLWRRNEVRALQHGFPVPQYTVAN